MGYKNNNYMKIYRIEHKDTKAGMWYNLDGTYNGVIMELTEGEAKSAPMPYTKEHQYQGKKWFSAARSMKQLDEWFSVKNQNELYDRGYRLYRMVVKEFVIKEGEVLFTREGVINQVKINEEAC